MFNVFIAAAFFIGFALFFINLIMSFGSKTKSEAVAAMDWMGAGLFIMIISALTFITHLLITSL